jgi:hypothetical protein
LLLPHPREQRLDLGVDGVIAAHRNTEAASRRHLLGRLVDRSRPIERRPLAANAAAAHINRCAFLTQHERNPLAPATTGAGYHRDPAVDTLHSV